MLDDRDLYVGFNRELYARASPPSTTQHRKGIRELIYQLNLIGGAALLYFVVRGQTQGSEADAVRHGLSLLQLEGRFGLDLEARIQDAVLGSHVLVSIVNWVYIWGHWPVIVTTLFWLHRRDPSEYARLRNAMFASGAIGLVVFTLYPVAPPRLLGTGMVDTVTEYSLSYRLLQPPALVNKFAALPSLHVGWNLLVGIAIFRVAGSRLIRIIGLLSPFAMVAAVMLSANHYVLDAAAGSVVALCGLFLSSVLWPQHRYGQHRSCGPIMPIGQAHPQESERSLDDGARPRQTRSASGGPIEPR